MVKEYEAKFGIDKPLWRAISHLSRRHGPVRFRLFDRQLSAKGQRHDLGRSALDGLPLDRRRRSFRSSSATFSARSRPGRARRVGCGAHAAAAGDERDPVLSAGLDPRLRRRLQPAVGAALRRLHGRSDSAMELLVRPRRRLPRHSAGARDHPRLARRLGARHAGDDGDDAGRGLRHLRRGERALGSHHFRRLRHPQRDTSASDGACAIARAARIRRRARRDRVRLSRHRHAAVPGHPRLRFLPRAGNRLPRDRRDRPCDAHSRS